MKRVLRPLFIATIVIRYITNKQSNHHVNKWIQCLLLKINGSDDDNVNEFYITMFYMCYLLWKQYFHAIVQFFSDRYWENPLC